jgi:hypothetical protein
MTVQETIDNVLVEEALPRPAPGDTGGLRYLLSYLLMRVVIGVLGLALPMVLVLGDWALTGGVPWRGSLSAYYYSGGGDVFVGCMVATGLFLLTYRATEASWENRLSVVAGLAALGVALFPTGGGDRTTPLQQALGEQVVSAVHFASAAVFIGSLALISMIFGLGEGRRPDSAPTRQRTWRWVHWSLSAVIVVSVLVIVLQLLGDYSLFVGEVFAVVAFGLSWLVKGSEIRKVHLPRRPSAAQV